MNLQYSILTLADGKYLYNGRSYDSLSGAAVAARSDMDGECRRLRDRLSDLECFRGLLIDGKPVRMITREFASSIDRVGGIEEIIGGLEHPKTIYDLIWDCHSNQYRSMTWLILNTLNDRGRLEYVKDACLCCNYLSKVLDPRSSRVLEALGCPEKAHWRLTCQWAEAAANESKREHKRESGILALAAKTVFLDTLDMPNESIDASFEFSQAYEERYMAIEDYYCPFKASIESLRVVVGDHANLL